MSYKTERFFSELLREEYKKIHHPSGLVIYLFPKKLSTAYAMFGVKYGSIHSRFRPPENGSFITVPDGIAHFLEHKLFFNEDGSDSFARFSDYGADANAYTSESRTCYLFSCTDRFSDSLAELLTFVTHPYFTPDSVASEVGIISEEIRMYDDNPSDRCFYGMLEAMYEHHSIRRNICGSVASIRKITAELLYECYRAFYRLDNMILAVAGDVSEEELLRVADRVLPATAPTLPMTETEDENAKESASVYLPYREKRMQVAKPLFNIGFKDVAIPADGEARQRRDAAMSILNEILFSRAGALYNSLLESERISPALSYGYTISRHAAYNSIGGEAEDPRLVLAEIRAYLTKVEKEGLAYDDFLRAKRVMYAEFVKAFDSTESIAGNLFTFASEDADLLSYARHLSEVTFEEISALLKTAFRQEATALSVILPLAEEDPIQQEE
jgi:predicted Zn-dependent peptidase